MMTDYVAAADAPGKYLDEKNPYIRIMHLIDKEATKNDP
jgi:hypothetical protein